MHTLFSSLVQLRPDRKRVEIEPGRSFVKLNLHESVHCQRGTALEFDDLLANSARGCRQRSGHSAHSVPKVHYYNIMK